MVDFGSDILDTEVPEVEPLDVDISSEPQHELAMAFRSGEANSSSPVIFDFSLQSRVEVILNAIINDLVYGEHPKSRVEQILLYILGEVNELPTPHSRVEELLIDLALELESTDISPKSRVEQILLVLLNQPYEFPITHSRVEELLVQLQTHVSEVTGPLPITISTDGTALIDYRIYGNMEQSGTPTPEHPIMPSGCGERTENLWDFSISTKGLLQNDGSIDTNQNYTTSDYIPVTAGQSYTFRALSGYGSGRYIRAAWYDSDKQFVDYSSVIKEASVGSVYTNSYTAPNNASYARVSGFSYLDSEFMFVEGSTAPASYIPPGYKLPILSNSTITNIYLGEVQSTRRIKKLVLTGEEIWYQSYAYHGSCFAYLKDIASNAKARSSIVCTHVDSQSGQYHYGQGKIDENSLSLWLFDSSVSAQTFKSYLAAQYAAGTPVTVWYVLEEPETAVVNEPLMKIGDYADTLSMEQAGVSIPTIKGATVIDYDGTPKPSQMYVKYNES